MNIIDDLKESRKTIPSTDKDCFTMTEMMNLTDIGESAIYRILQKKLKSGEWEYAGQKRNHNGYPTKAYRLVKKKK